MPTYLPTSELVACAWLDLYVADVTAGMVATTLPRDPATWATNGFLQAQAIPGRLADVDLPRRLPVIQVDAWACNLNGNAPPWALAAQLAERVRAATELPTQAWVGKALDLNKADYLDARVWAVYALTEPVRVLGDVSGYARFTLDIAVDWVSA